MKPKSEKTRIARLEILVDELIKDAPIEARVRVCMEAAGLSYTKDPVARMQTVMTALDGLRVTTPPRGRDL